MAARATSVFMIVLLRSNVVAWMPGGAAGPRPQFNSGRGRSCEGRPKKRQNLRESRRTTAHRGPLAGQVHPGEQPVEAGIVLEVGPEPGIDAHPGHPCVRRRIVEPVEGRV